MAVLQSKLEFLCSMNPLISGQL